MRLSPAANYITLCHSGKKTIDLQPHSSLIATDSARAPETHSMRLYTSTPCMCVKGMHTCHTHTRYAYNKYIHVKHLGTRRPFPNYSAAPLKTSGVVSKV